jgi:hypothetical protein
MQAGCEDKHCTIGFGLATILALPTLIVNTTIALATSARVGLRFSIIDSSYLLGHDYGLTMPCSFPDNPLLHKQEPQ